MTKSIQICQKNKKKSLCPYLWRYQSDFKRQNWKHPKNAINLGAYYCYIWHINTSKCVYLLDIYCVKVWWRYVSPNTNAIHFCDFFSEKGQLFDLPKQNVPKNQKYGHVRIISISPINTYIQKIFRAPEKKNQAL